MRHPDRLVIPEKLYWRQPEVESLLAAFDRIVDGGACELVLVFGFSGIGKSSVVHELQPVLVAPRGLFASGKFDRERVWFKPDRSIRKAPPRKERFDLNEAVNEVVVMVGDAIARNKISVRTHLMDRLISVQDDRVQLQQVLVNLILNAIEAMNSIEDGERELSVRTSQSQNGEILVAVHDSGSGVDSGNLARVFEPFYTETSGVGMGPSICQTIINGHGGRLSVSANEPRGAVFQFTLPPAQEGL